jgi:hypothetical protein
MPYMLSFRTVVLISVFFGAVASILFGRLNGPQTGIVAGASISVLHLGLVLWLDRREKLKAMQQTEEV